MKKKPTVINSFEQLNEVITFKPITEHSYDGSTLIHTFIDAADWRGVKNPTETKRVSLLAKSKRRY